MTELEKTEYAKSFIDKLANGINPLDGTVLKEDDIVNNVRISRCLFYVSDVLRQVIENGGTDKKKASLQPFALTCEQIARFEFSQNPIAISEITKRINALKENENMKKISHGDLTNWLISVGMLYEKENAYNGKISKQPTEQGENAGITLELRTGQHGNYNVTVYDKSAQAFIIDNLDAILALKYKK